MLDSLKYVKDSLTKCRVAYRVYKNKDEVDNENEDEKKKYALFKIIDFIKEIYADNQDEQGKVMNKLKNITYNCNPIIEERFGLSDYLFKQKVLTQTYHDLNIDPKKMNPNNKFIEFFQENDLLKELYIKDNDNEAIIFKLSSATTGEILYIRLSRRNLHDRQSKESLAENPVKIFKIDMEDKNKKQLLIYSLINNEYFKIVEEAMGAMHGLHEGTIIPRKIHKFNKISINKRLAYNFKNQQAGGIGKKTIKTKSKPLKNTILQKKEIFGKDMRIYKINGSKKEYVKYKGNLISISDYKKIIKLKKN